MNRNGQKQTINFRNRQKWSKTTLHVNKFTKPERKGQKLA